MDIKKYFESLDQSVLNAFADIIIEEKKTERLMKSKNSDERFLENLYTIIDKHADYWEETER